VALVNESMAKRCWSGREPLGGRVTIRDHVFTVVGVLRDTKQGDLTETTRPCVYLSLPQVARQAGLLPMTLLAWTQRAPEDALRSIRSVLSEVAPSVPVTQSGSIEDRLAELLTPQRMAASLLGWLSMLALIIVGVGIYGSAAYEAAGRTREIGIRLALGATPSGVLRLVTRGSLIPVATGIALGVPLAVTLGRLASSFLYGIGAADPFTYAVTIGVLLAAGAAASYLPARRAARVDPLVALREE
jgi:predicted lysophospholipase L1 biosynthesis ABC-type transport system permease subunit